MKFKLILIAILHIAQNVFADDSCTEQKIYMKVLLVESKYQEISFIDGAPHSVDGYCESPIKVKKIKVKDGYLVSLFFNNTKYRVEIDETSAKFLHLDKTSVDKSLLVIKSICTSEKTKNKIIKIRIAYLYEYP